MFVRSLTLIFLAGAPAAVLAEAAAADAGPAGSEILVTGRRADYGVRSTSTATRTNTDVKDVPQAMTVVSGAQIADQSLRSMGELLLFVPGASPSSGEGNRDQVTLRGNNSTADFFIDGVRDDAQYLRDFYNVDRVEVLRGANAMIFGRGGGGGVINRVRKVAATGSFAEGSAGIDSEGGYRLSADLNAALSGSLSGRINGVYEDGNSFRQHYDLKRYGVNPTLGWRPDGATRIDVGYEFFHDRRTADRGLPSVTDPAALDEPLRGFDRTFFGDPGISYALVDAQIGTLAVERQLGGGFTLRNRAQLARYDKFYQNVFASDLQEATATVLLAGYNNRNDRRNAFNQTDLIWDGRIGGIGQTLLVGAEFGWQRSRNFRTTAILPAATLRVPLSNPTVVSGATFAPAATDANNRVRATVAAFYVQDQLRLSPLLEIVAGVRFDRFRLSVDDLRPANLDLSRVDHLVSPRVGLIVKPATKLSLYASFSRSYLPQSGDQFSSLDANTAALKPERFDNYEVGAKWEPVAGLLATAAFYRLDRSNTRAADPNNPTRIVLTGAQRSRGLELGLERSVARRWKVSAGYAWQKAEITESTTAAPAGREAPLVPRHSASLWNRFDATKRLGVGLGVVARSRSFTTISNQVILPAYARVDGALFYKIRPTVQVQVNAENLLGAHYFPTANADNNIAPGAPRTVRASLRVGI